MELIVKNFGPIKDAHIQTKRYNVLIGNTSTGKSVLAKLISIAYEIEFYFIENGNFDAFAKLLKKYCIDFPFSDSTQIEISFALAHWNITKDNFRVVKSIGSALFDNDVVELSNEEELIDIYKEISVDGDLQGSLDTNNPLVKEAMSTLKELFENITNGRKTDLSTHSQSVRDLVYRAFVTNVYDKNASVYVPAERNLMSDLRTISSRSLNRVLIFLRVSSVLVVCTKQQRAKTRICQLTS